MEAREKHLVSFLYSPPLSLRPASLWTWALNFSEPQWSFCLYPPLGSVYSCIHNTQHAFGCRLVLMIASQVLLTIESYFQSFALRNFLAWLGWLYEWHPQSKSLLYFFSSRTIFFIPVALLFQWFSRQNVSELMWLEQICLYTPAAREKQRNSDWTVTTWLGLFLHLTGCFLFHGLWGWILGKQDSIADLFDVLQKHFIEGPLHYIPNLYVW